MNLEGIKVLIIESNHHSIENAKKGLINDLNLNVEIHIATNLKESIALMSENNYHYVLSSLLPNSDIGLKNQFEQVVLTCLAGRSPVAFIIEEESQLHFIAISSDGLLNVFRASKEGKKTIRDIGLNSTIHIQKVDSCDKSPKVWAEAFEMLKNVEKIGLVGKQLLFKEKNISEKQKLKD